MFEKIYWVVMLVAIGSAFVISIVRHDMLMMYIEGIALGATIYVLIMEFFNR